MKASREWSTFFRIPLPNTTDQALALDPGWCDAKGVYSGSAVVLRLLKGKVAPLLHNLRNSGLKSFHFLIHDRQSGVPTTEDDKAAFIHLRLFFKRAVHLDLTVLGFEMTAPSGKMTEIGGLDLSMVSGGVRRAVDLINMQSAWVINVLTNHNWKDDGEMVRQMRQFLHYFANMTQMKLIG